MLIAIRTGDWATDRHCLRGVGAWRVAVMMMGCVRSSNWRLCIPEIRRKLCKFYTCKCAMHIVWHYKSSDKKTDGIGNSFSYTSTPAKSFMVEICVYICVDMWRVSMEIRGVCMCACVCWYETNCAGFGWIECKDLCDKYEKYSKFHSCVAIRSSCFHLDFFALHLYIYTYYDVQ